MRVTGTRVNSMASRGREFSVQTVDHELESIRTGPPCVLPANMGLSETMLFDGFSSATGTAMLNVLEGRQGAGHSGGQVGRRLERAQLCAHTGSHASQHGTIFLETDLREPYLRRVTRRHLDRENGLAGVGRSGCADPRLPG